MSQNDNVMSLFRKRRAGRDDDILELKLQMAEVRTKLNLVMWGVGFLITNQILFYFIGK